MHLDTTKPGTHTILYVVTDPKCLSGSALRSVVAKAANDNPNARSSPAVSPEPTRPWRALSEPAPRGILGNVRLTELGVSEVVIIQAAPPPASDTYTNH